MTIKNKKSKSSGGFTPLEINRKKLWMNIFFLFNKEWPERDKTNPSKFLTGFTLIEIIIVVAMIGLLAYLVMAPLASFKDQQTLQIETDKTLAFIAKTRSLTLASANDKQYGVRFLADRLIRFSGLTFSSSSPDNITLLINPTVSISNIALVGNGTDIIFDRLSGKISQNGVLTLSILSNANRVKIITILPVGVASAN